MKKFTQGTFYDLVDHIIRFQAHYPNNDPNKSFSKQKDFIVLLHINHKHSYAFEHTTIYSKVNLVKSEEQHICGFCLKFVDFESTAKKRIYFYCLCYCCLVIKIKFMHF